MYFCVKSNVELLVIWQFKMELTQHQFATSFPPVLAGVKLVKTRVLFTGLSCGVASVVCVIFPSFSGTMKINSTSMCTHTFIYSLYAVALFEKGNITPLEKKLRRLLY